MTGSAQDGSSTRLDLVLVGRGLARSRTQAQALIKEGRVRVSSKVVTRPGAVTPQDAEIVLSRHDPERGEAVWITRGWVGRGALKLDHALSLWGEEGLSISGQRCLDIGASTGGFTQVLLEYGARQVIALDVGHGQLSSSLLNDPRVTNLEGTNIRHADASSIGGAVDVVVSDVSFISLRHVIPLLPSLCLPHADVVLLVKPQFEAGPESTRGGVVRSAHVREHVLAEMDRLAREHGMAPRGLDRSPVTGGKGNIEYVLWLRVCPPGMMDCAQTEEAMAARRAALREEEER